MLGFITLYQSSDTVIFLEQKSHDIKQITVAHSVLFNHHLCLMQNILCVPKEDLVASKEALLISSCLNALQPPI